MRGPVRVLELRSVRGTGGGPEKTILVGAALADPAGYAITVCYLRDLRDQVFAVHERASDLAVDYVEIVERHSFDVRIWAALRRLVQQRQIAIVHSHDYKTNFYAWLLSRFEPVVPLATLHGYTGHSKREVLYYGLDRRLVRRFPHLIAVSGELRDELLAHGAAPQRVTCILNGIDEHAFRRDPARRGPARAALGLSDADVVIGGVGRLEPQKRFDLLMDVVARLAARVEQPLKLVVVGEGGLRAALEARRAATGLESACLLTGHRTDIAELHHAFDIFVQSSDYEGTPNAVLEAMAMETPIVATDVGGTRELITSGAHGLVVPKGDVAGLADAVEETLCHPAQAAERAAAARRRVETELSFRARMAKVEAIYDDLSRDAGRRLS